MTPPIALAIRYLAEEVWQDQRIANEAIDDLVSPDIQGFLVNPTVDLAPNLPFGTHTLGGVPFKFVLGLDPSTINHQVQRSFAAAIGDVHG